MKILKHGDQSSCIDGCVRMHCQCGCITKFEKPDMDYVQCMTNVCGELHKTTTAHADTLAVTCPECHQRRIIKMKDVKIHHSNYFKWGVILKIISVLNVCSIIGFQNTNANIAYTLISLTIVVSVALFAMGRFVCDQNREKIYDILLKKK